jgi:hypothetical protein
MKLFIVNLKAFGDSVIAFSAIKRIHTDQRGDLPNIIVGEHVRPLACALQIEQSIRFIGNLSWNDVPALFDVRKHGALAALKSFFEIRKLINSLPADSHLIFDNLGCRERWLGNGFYLHDLAHSSKNIYIAYDQFFQSMGFGINNKFDYSRNIQRAIIIPGSRIHDKVIPAVTIHNYLIKLWHLNIKADVLLLEGESFDMPRCVNPIVIPRKFSMLIDEIRKSNLVISADSLPSHLAEYLQIPVFVSMRTSNIYWLPSSSYQTKGWATFYNIEPFSIWLANNFRL